VTASEKAYRPKVMSFHAVNLEITSRVDLGGWVAFADLEGVGAKCLHLSGY
jgi:hypothetical protein